MNKNIKRPIIVFAAGLVLVAASSIGATRATITYQTSAQNVDFSTSTLTVDLQEERNGEYTSVVSDGALEFTSLQNEDGKYDFNIGQLYEENVKVVNNSPGEYDEYVRVNVRKSWVADGVKDTDLNPDTIVLDIADGWIVDDVTDEGSIYYMTTPLEYGQSAAFIEHIKIDNKVWDYVNTVAQSENTVVNEYRYDDEAFLVELRVDAVQAHNGAEAMLGAWGVDAVISDNGEIQSINGSDDKTPVSSTN